MPAPALYLLIATLLPLASFTVLVFLGKRMGRPLAGYLGTAAIFGSLVCSVLAMVTWLYAADKLDGELAWGKNKLPIVSKLEWIPTDIVAKGNGLGMSYLNVSIYVDSLTVIMFCM